MFYRVTVDTNGPVVYEIPFNDVKSEEEAINLAEEWFSQYIPKYTIEKVSEPEDNEWFENWANKHLKNQNEGNK